MAFSSRFPVAIVAIAALTASVPIRRLLRSTLSAIRPIGSAAVIRLCRWGGEECLVLLPACEPEEAERMA